MGWLFIVIVLPAVLWGAAQIVGPWLLWKGFARWDRFVDRTFQPGDDGRSEGEARSAESGSQPPRRSKPGEFRPPDETGVGDEEWDTPRSGLR